MTTRSYHRTEWVISAYAIMFGGAPADLEHLTYEEAA